ncbi:MAG: hypothetical protein J7K98_02490 [Candidatus Aenigmarchaeota archaeon]|nr:hypothetical protein [Candidatus Aenigmarchaeota archaeon]
MQLLRSTDPISYDSIYATVHQNIEKIALNQGFFLANKYLTKRVKNALKFVSNLDFVDVEDGKEKRLKLKEGYSFKVVLTKSGKDYVERYISFY